MTVIRAYTMNKDLKRSLGWNKMQLSSKHGRPVTEPHSISHTADNFQYQ
jgi:hypothetical protein